MGRTMSGICEEFVRVPAITRPILPKCLSVEQKYAFFISYLQQQQVKQQQQSLLSLVKSPCISKSLNCPCILSYCLEQCLKLLQSTTQTTTATAVAATENGCISCWIKYGQSHCGHVFRRPGSNVALSPRRTRLKQKIISWCLLIQLSLTRQKRDV